MSGEFGGQCLAKENGWVYPINGRTQSRLNDFLHFGDAASGRHPDGTEQLLSVDAKGREGRKVRTEPELLGTFLSIPEAKSRYNNNYL
jgi:hypothetical protein